MKYIRKFNSIQERDAALANADFNVLAGVVSGGTITIEIHEGTPVVDYSIPFYVENITQQSETLTIAGYDMYEMGDYLEIPLEISTDGTAWTTFGTTGATPLTRTLNPGDKVYLRATTNTWYVYQEDPWENEYFCYISGVSKVGGNIMSLLYGSNFTGNETTFPSGSSRNFSSLFRENRNLVSASELILPVITLTGKCYEDMFFRCTSLTTAPALPATTLANNCYSGMFNGCSSLATAPVLSVTTLAPRCYNGMFRDCTSLTTTPELPATTLTTSCYECMFQGCTSLTTTPVLPATTLANWCYRQMFQNCTNLNHIECFAADISASDCTKNWTSGVSATGTFIKDPSMSNWTIGVNGIPSGWTVEDAQS